MPTSSLPITEIPGSDFAATGSIPLTISTLRAQGEELLLDAKDMSPDFQHRLKLVLQGGLALAQSGELAKEHMANTQAADQARSARRKAQNRRQTQNGGVIYASEAREKAKAREVTDVEKAEIALRRAQNAKKKADTTAHKPFLDEIKAAYQARCKRLAEKKKQEMEQARLEKEQAKLEMKQAKLGQKQVKKTRKQAKKARRM